ncbi:hypothetical protein F8M41_018641 [Gigaspora margarita]|uniref:Uncharacterized protein n=1 Tax=Gigaspora margarita TaxID=4874 RepID=A0A8H4AL70_GIGMA|nr:hypothetical protein F8M41_018641 [Gigaspora margarita]
MSESNRFSVISNSDNSENHSNFHTYVVSPVHAFLHSHVVRPSKEYPLIFSSVILILLSILLLLSLLLVPSSSEITEPAISAISSAIIDAANTAADTMANTAEKIATVALGLLFELLSAFDNFKPRSPTANLAGFSQFLI